MTRAEPSLVFDVGAQSGISQNVGSRDVLDGHSLWSTS